MSNFKRLKRVEGGLSELKKVEVKRENPLLGEPAPLWRGVRVGFCKTKYVQCSMFNVQNSM